MISSASPFEGILKEPHTQGISRHYAVQYAQDELALRLLSECFEDEVFHIDAVVEEMARAHAKGRAYSISESAFASARAFDALYFSAIAAGFSPQILRDVMTIYPEVE